MRLRLNVLRQGKRYGTGIGWGGQDAHHFGQSGDQLFGSVDAVPVAADGFERVVDADILGGWRLELLKHGRDVAAGEDVAWQ